MIERERLVKTVGAFGLQPELFEFTGDVSGCFLLAFRTRSAALELVGSEVGNVRF